MSRTVLVLACVCLAESHTVPIHHRRLSSNHESTVDGGVSQGYIYTTVLLGKNRDPFSVILDTGSPLTIVPCQPCDDCGDHAKFRPDHALKEEFGIHYVEGSSLEGRYTQTSVWVSGTRVKYTIGCASRMTRLFKEQSVDGIMGLDEAPTSIVQQLRYAHKDTPWNTFTLHLTAESDHLIVGRNPDEEEYDARCPLFKSENNYYIRFLSLDMQGTRSHVSLGVSDRRMLIDSGTTFLYLERGLFTKVKQELRRYGFTTGERGGIGCVSIAFSKLPTLLIRGVDGCSIRLKPTQYAYASFGRVCIGIHDTGWGNDNTFGLIAMDERRTTFVLETPQYVLFRDL